MQTLINLGIAIGVIAAFGLSVALLGGVLKLLRVSDDWRGRICLAYVALAVLAAFVLGSLHSGSLGEAVEGVSWR